MHTHARTHPHYKRTMTLTETRSDRSSRNNSNSKNSNNNRHIRRTSSLKSIEQLNIWKNLTEASHVLSDHEDNSNEEQHGML